MARVTVLLSSPLAKLRVWVLAVMSALLALRPLVLTTMVSAVLILPERVTVKLALPASSA